MNASGWGKRTIKISDDTVRALRRRRAAGESIRSLAKEYGVAESTVSRIALRLNREDVQDDPQHPKA